MFNIKKIILECPCCGKIIESTKSELVEASYSQFVIDLYDIDEDCYDGSHLCKGE